RTQFCGRRFERVPGIDEQVADAPLHVANLRWSEHAFPATDGIGFGLFAVAAKRRIRIVHRSERDLLDAVVVQIVFNELANARQGFARILHQILVMNFHVIAAQRLTVTPALANDPAPEDGGHQEGAGAVPGQRTNPADAVQGGGDVAAVANNVDDERIGNRFLDYRKIEQVKRRRFGPAMGTLLAGDGFHHDAQEVAGIAAIFQHAIFDIFRIEAGALKQLAGEVGVEQLAAVAATREVTEAQAEQVEGLALR